MARLISRYLQRYLKPTNGESMNFVTDPADDQIVEIERGLDAHNARVASVRSVTPLRAVWVEAGRVVAGLVGSAYWGKLHVRLLWVDADHRSRGLGRHLMDWAEARGRDLGCTSAVVDTMSFQAPEFYVKLGFVQIGLSEGYEGGASRHYFEKRL